jgi:hypothetical protein
VGSVLRRLLFFFQRNQFDRDLEDELRFHEEMTARALADADGMSGDEARDLEMMRRFYADKVARFPEKASTIAFRPPEPSGR